MPGVLLFLWQDRVLFPAPAISRARLAELAEAAGAQEVSVETADGVSLYGWHVPGGSQRALLYFHGNGESVAHTRTVQAAAVAAGWDFVCVSPRGYPGSDGAPARGSLARDAEAAWALVTGPLGFEPGQVLLHGRSLGGGMAGSLMADVHPAGLVLESTFLSLVEVGGDAFPIYPVRLLLRHRAPTAARAPAVDYPVLILHGDQDQVISVRHGRRLAEGFPKATYVESRGFGHNDGLLHTDPAARAAWLRYLREAAGGL
ncbi:MAG: pimeloyl-ACP methyl ester carboxylesterase [Myxococcota bacterium]